MIKKVVIDTNILVSSLLSSNEDAATVRILKLLLNGHIIPIVTEDIAREYGNVLRRKKFNFPEKIVSILLEEIERKSIYIMPSSIDIDMPDDKDRPFMEALLADDEEYL